MIHNLRKIMHVFVGTILVVLGLAGLVLPFINGIILLIVGFIVLSFESPAIEKILLSLTQRNHHTHHWHMKLEKFLRKLFKK